MRSMPNEEAVQRLSSWRRMEPIHRSTGPDMPGGCAETGGKEMKLSTANKLSKKLSCQYGIVNPPEVRLLKYSRRGQSVILGYYNHEENRIELNAYLMELWPYHRICQVIKHELVHARSYQDFGKGGHGKHFRLLCDLFSINIDVRSAHSKLEG
jgi:hypothetical protein